MAVLRRHIRLRCSRAACCASPLWSAAVLPPLLSQQHDYQVRAQPLYSCVVPIPATTVGIFVFISQNFLGHLHLICPSAQLCPVNPAGIVCRDRHPTHVNSRNSLPPSRHATHRSPAIPVLSMACGLFLQNTGGMGGLRSCHSRVTSHESRVATLCPLCFHGLTNCFSRKPFPFTTICVAPGCHPPQHLLPILEDAKMKHRPNQ